MAATLKIPTIFTAIDKISGVVKNMGKNVTGFANKMEAGIARGNRLFRKLTPSIGEAGKQLLSFASAAAVAGAIIGGLHFSADALMEYEDAVASFRTIVADLPDADFKKYEASIGTVAKKTKVSTIEVAQSYEKIAGLNADFAKTAEGISAVSQASITLAQASGDDLGTSAENLVGIMNQFNLAASESDRVINVLAAGQAVGAANITQSSEAYKNFGSVASSANITLEESVGLIQTLGKFSLFGAEAGTKLRGVTLQLQKAGMGYKSGQFNINDALEQAKGKFDKLKTAKKQDAFLTKLFGAENITAGKILLNNIDIYKDFTKGVTGTGQAQIQAAIKNDTLSKAIEQAKNSWVNYITTNDEAKEGSQKLKEALKYVADNMDSIVKWGLEIIRIFAIWKGLLLASEAVMWLYNVALGVQGALTGKASIAIGKNTVALGAYKVAQGISTAFAWASTAATYAWTAAQWLLNAALTANPIGLIIVGIAALIALVVLVINKWDEWGAALSIFMGPLGLVISLIQSFRRNWDMIVQAFKTDGIVGGLKAIGKTILDAVLQPLEQLLTLIAKVPVIGAPAAAGAMQIRKWRQEMGVSLEGNNKKDKPALENPSVAQQRVTQETISSEKQKVEIEIKDKGNNVEKTKSKGKLDIPVKTTSTNGQR